MITAFERGVVTTDHGLEWRSPDSQGYGAVTWTVDGISKQSRAHRIAWILQNGPIPEGYEIDHNPSCPKTCITVDHLRCLTKSEHTKLGWERGELNGGWGTKRVRIHPPRPEPFLWKIEKQCLHCQTIFTPNSPKAIYCSSLCNSRAKEEKRKGIRYPRPSSTVCNWCGNDFTPKRVDSRFCSRKCIDDNQNFEKKLRKQEVKDGMS